MVQESIEKLNSGLAKYETVKKYHVLPKEFTIEDGDLTPSMKVKRKLVCKKYIDLLEGMYKD